MEERRINVSNELLAGVIVLLALIGCFRAFTVYSMANFVIYLTVAVGSILHLFGAIGGYRNPLVYIVSGLWSICSLYTLTIFFGLFLVEAYWLLHRRMRISGARPFEGFDIGATHVQVLGFIEAIALIASAILVTIQAGPAALVTLGFLYEIVHPTCIHRARPLRGLTAIIFIAAGWSAIPATIWLTCHWLRVAHEPQAHELQQRFVNQHREERFVFHADTIIGVPNPFVTFEIRSKGTCTVSRPGWRNTLKASNFLEADVERALMGYGNIRFHVKKGAAHSEKELVARVPSPKWIAELLNQKSGDEASHAESE